MTQQYDLALIKFKEHKVLYDSIYNSEKTEVLHELERKYETEKKDNEIALLSKNAELNKLRNTRLWIVLIAALLTAAGFYSRWRYVRKSRDLISKEKERSENLLLNILPHEIAEELKEKGEAVARDFEMASILFTDFSSFTQASEKLSASELVHEINECFKAFDLIVEKYNVEKIKTIGDAYMAAGGVPIPSDISVKNTVLAAIEMQDFINLRKAKNEEEGKHAFEMRVGIHTGPVVAGIVGVKKFQYDI